MQYQRFNNILDIGRIISDLKSETRGNLNWAFFPMGLSKTENLAIWILPEKMLLLRQLGMQYGLHRQDNDPPCIRTEVTGLVVVKVKKDNTLNFFGNPPVTNSNDKPFALVGLNDCRICLSEETGAWINLQHFIDDTFNFYCRRLLGCSSGTDISNSFENLCRRYCQIENLKDSFKNYEQADDLLAEYVNEDLTRFFMNFYACIPGEMGGYWWSKDMGACRQIVDFCRNHVCISPTPENTDQFIFRLMANFGQVKETEGIAFIRAILSGNGGKLEIYRGLHNFRSGDDFLGIAEQILKLIFPNHGD